jgi:hypothetical protein
MTILTRNARSPRWNRRDRLICGAAPSASPSRMLKTAVGFVLASLRASTYGKKYASAPSLAAAAPTGHFEHPAKSLSQT